MHSAFIKINGIPTRVTTWGKWIEENFTNEDSKDIVLVICGNPGLSTFYYPFLEAIHQQTGCHVWVLSHAGHEVPSEPTTMKLPDLADNEQLYNLSGQIAHKREFIKKYVPANCKLHLMGHSIGAFMCTQLLKDPHISQATANTFLLFPTLENIAKTPNGKFYINVVQRIRLFLMFLVHLVMLFPEFLRIFLAKIFLYIQSTRSEYLNSVLSFARPEVVRNVMFLADDEMLSVRERDDSVLRANCSKIIALYGKTDGWAPIEMYHRLVANVPGIRAELADDNIEHSFVLRHSREVACLVSNWLMERVAKG